MTDLATQQGFAEKILQTTRNLVWAVENCDYDKAQKAIEDGALFQWANLLTEKQSFLHLLIDLHPISIPNFSSWMTLLWQETDQSLDHLGAWVIKHAPSSYPALLDRQYHINEQDYIAAVEMEQISIFETLNQIQPWTELQYLEPTHIFDDTGMRMFGKLDSHPLNLLMHVSSPSQLKNMLEHCPLNLNSVSETYTKKSIHYFMDQPKGDELIALILEYGFNVSYSARKLLDISTEKFSPNNAVWKCLLLKDGYWEETKAYQRLSYNPDDTYHTMKKLDDYKRTYQKHHTLQEQTTPVSSSRPSPRM